MCICCDKKISLLYPESSKTEEDIVFNKETRQVRSRKSFDEEIKINAGSHSWDDGVVDLISVNYGSRFDGDEFVIAICDDCLEKKMMTGNIAYIDNYLGYIKDTEKYKKSRIAWRRYNRIDDILND